MFGLILAATATLLHLYVFARAVTLPRLRGRTSRLLVIIVGTLLWLLFLAARVYGHERTGPAAALIEALGMDWFGAVFVLAWCLLAVDLVTAFGLVFRRVVPLLRTAALVAGVAFAVLAAIQGRRVVVETYDVAMPGLPAELDGRTVVAISDLHIRPETAPEWVAAKVTQVRALNPDLIVVLGDTLDGHGLPSAAVAGALRGLYAPLGVWGVLGNHDNFGNPEQNAAYLEKAGIRLLRDQTAELSPGFVLAGVNDLSRAADHRQSAAEYARTFAQAPAGARLLLSHAPVGAVHASALGVSLMLSGHTHGGQLWPFSYFVRARYPLLDGRYGVFGTTVIVCRGTGTWGPRIRLWRPGSILKLTLHRPASG